MSKKTLYVIFSILLIGFLFLAIIFKQGAISDIMIAMGFLAITYYLDRKFQLSSFAVLLLGLTTLLNPVGIFGLYSYFMFGYIGYDKVIHFLTTFTVAYGILDIFKKKTLLNYVTVMLIVMGLGSMVEISEFIGYKYFGINSGGVFTIHDTLPYIKSDLQRYDTDFDRMFNFLGVIAAALVVAVKTSLELKRR